MGTDQKDAETNGAPEKSPAWRFQQSHPCCGRHSDPAGGGGRGAFWPGLLCTPPGNRM